MGDTSPQKDGGSGGGKYTPASKRLGNDAGAESDVVVRTASRGGVPIHYPQLTDTNYGVWAVKMRIIMRTLGCWTAVEGKAKSDQGKDKDAFTALSQSLPDSMVMAIAEYETAAEAWEAIRRMGVGEDRVKKARVKQLKRQLDRLKMDNGETIAVFGQRLTTLVAGIRSLGEKINDESVIKCLFNAVLDRFADVVNTIEQWGDLSTMPVSEAVGRLAAFEDGQRGRRRSGNGKDEQLMLVTRALEQLMKGKKSGDGAGSSSSLAGKKGGDRGKPGKDRGKHKKNDKFDITKVRCYNCNDKGHFQSDCPEPKHEKANLAEKEDDDPTLLMMDKCELVLSDSVAEEQVFLNEEKVVPKLTGKREMSWYLDTGASNRMTGRAEKFAELDQSVTGRIQFGEGSAVEICGRGSVLLQCHTGEHRVLSDVYFIPWLKNNIISLGQLDENGCKYSAEDGVMTVLDRQRNVLARVRRTKNRMYILNIQQTEPICLMAHAKESSWLWHMRYNHVNFRSLRSLAAEGMVEGMSILEQVGQVCEGCMIAKQRRLPFPSQTSYRASQQLQLVHGDLCGPIHLRHREASATFSWLLTITPGTCGWLSSALRMRHLRHSEKFRNLQKQSGI